MPWVNQIDPTEGDELRAAVDRSEPIWRDVLDSSADEVRAIWRRSIEQSAAGPRPIAWLRVTDEVEGATIPDEKFAPEEFGNTDRLSDRFYRIWGKLLRARSHVQLHRLDELVKSMPGD